MTDDNVVIYEVPDHGIYCCIHKISHKEDICPKCKEVGKKQLCQDCKKHKGTVNYSESVLASVHGFSKMICTCCYFKLVQQSFNDVSVNYAKLKKELQENECK